MRDGCVKRLLVRQKSMSGFRFWQPQNPPSAFHGVLPMKCPACDSSLQMTERSGVEIDYCPACRGVWLDRGELDKIIERSGRDVAGGQLSEDRDRHYDSNGSSASKDHSHPKKKESFWSELFDFG